MKLSAVERKAIFTIDRRYNERIAAIRNASTEPHGRIDPQTVATLRTLRASQYAEWRAALNADHAIQFDYNRKAKDDAAKAIKARLSKGP